MTRPSVRRRPTALRLTETNQKYVLAAAVSTFLASTVSAYALRYARSGASGSRGALIDAVLCAGLTLVGSALQRQYLPLEGVTAAESFSWPSKIDASLATGVLGNAVALLAKFYAVEMVGPARTVAFLLPAEGLYRAHRGGFIRVDRSSVVLTSVALALGIASDYAAHLEAPGDLLVGYAAMATSIVASFLSISMQTQTPGCDLSAGLPVLLAGLIARALGTVDEGGSNSMLLFALVVLPTVGSRSWRATQPRAIATSLKLAWPLIITGIAFVSLNLLHDMSVPQAISLAVLYASMYRLVQTSTIANSSQSAANVVPTARIPSQFGGYYIKEILKDKESRDIFYFLLLNLSFMVVQMLYGIWTNSLGLISDSIHMFFDCLALAVGLVAAVMSKWPASRSHPFGFAKVEIISGFANGIFLVLISISIMIEAVERLMEPPEMKTDQLLLVSTLGLGVNLVGIFAFNHGHHHGHSHGHSHGHDGAHSPDHKKKPEPLPTIHTPRASRTDSPSDTAVGLRSPFPNFSDFSGFDASPRSPLVGLGFGDSLLELKENTLGVPNGGSHGADRGRSPSRSRSPVRRPGSPLKNALEPSLPDLIEGETHSHSHVHRSNGDLHEEPHDHGHDLHHHNHIHHNHANENATKQIDKRTTENEPHLHKMSPSVSQSHHHSHSKTASYDLTAGLQSPSSCQANGHSHNHGHSHDHGHGHGHAHGHGHGHDHSHNMEGIFLHILADTLGSAGVIVSTLLIRYFKWTGFDPLASIFIAVLIFLSVLPLLKSSFSDLLLTLQDDQEYTLREVLGEVSLISGVGDIPFVRFWVDGERKMHGILTIRAGIDGDLEAVRTKVRRKLEDGVPDLADVVVQVDRNG